MKLIVTGGGGLVANALCEVCTAQGDEVVSYSHVELDISDQAKTKELIQTDRPDAVINCAAYTDVDGCESNPELAFAANAFGPENLAFACRSIGAGFLTISTDYVFDGHKEGFYTQRDNPNPQSVYAKSKLEGERRAQTAHARTIVVRSGFIFGKGGRNFLSTIVERTRRGEKLKAIDDSYGTPTYAVHLAKRLRLLAELDLPGLFHVINEGEGVSFADFARAALDASGFESSELELVHTASLKRPAPRPINSRLRCLLSPALGLPPLPSWQDALNDFLSQTAETQAGVRA